MANREIGSLFKAEVATAAGTINTDTTTAGGLIDMQGYDSLTFLIHTATFTAGTITPAIVDGDTTSPTDAVDDAELSVTEASVAFTTAAADDNAVKKISYLGKKRYVKCNLVSASSANAVIGVIAIKGKAGIAPVA